MEASHRSTYIQTKQTRLLLMSFPLNIAVLNPEPLRPDMARPYKHTTLTSPRLIRLLRLKCGEQQQRNTSTLECELSEASLDYTLAYSALSYAWDSQSPTELVLCDGRELYVTTNCAAALRNRILEPVVEDEAIWIDSICIDQSSDKERSHQVTLMAEIYSKAQLVIVWLGEGDEKSIQTMNELAHLAWLAKTSPELVESRYRKAADAIASDRFANWPADLVNPLTFWSLERLPQLLPLFPVFGLSWYERLWTLQEIVLAKKATVIYGGSSIPWEDVRLVSDALTAGNASRGFTQYPGDSFQRVRAVGALRSLLRIDKETGPQQYRLPDDHPFGPLEACVSEGEAMGIASHFIVSCGLEASDPTDKVYGQYAILHNYGIELPVPDYNKPPYTIYEETARAIITHDASLELLYFVSIREGSVNVTTLPSWVPDFSYTSFAWIPGFEFTAAAGNSKAQFQFDEHGRLSLYGVRIGRITARTDTVDGPEKCSIQIDWSSRRSTLLWHYPIIRQFQLWARFALGDGCIRGNGAEAFCCVLLQEIALSAQASPAGWSRLMIHFMTWIQALSTDYTAPNLTSQCTATQTSPSAIDSIDKATCQSLLDDEIDDDGSFSECFRTEADRQVEQMERISWHLEENTASHIVQEMAVTRADGNCLFRTDGGLLGIATKAILEGDEVYLMAGMRLPMVVRWVGPMGCRLIGAAYVHGVMKGEMWGIGWDALAELKVV